MLRGRERAREPLVLQQPRLELSRVEPLQLTLRDRAHLELTVPPAQAEPLAKPLLAPDEPLGEWVARLQPEPRHQLV